MSTQDRMDFMSLEHVAAMNERLREAEAVRAACQELDDTPRVVQFRLTGGPDGREIYWTLTYDRTIQFSLEPHPAPDVLLTGDWTTMIRATAAAKQPALEVHGDPELCAQLIRILEVARPVATFSTRLPQV